MSDQLRDLTTVAVPGLVQTPSRLDLLRVWRTPRRLLALVLLWPALLAVLWVTNPAPGTLLVVASVGTALVAATYVPAPGQTVGQAFGGTCGIAAICLALLGANSAAGGTALAPWTGLVLVGLAVAHRVMTAGSCAPLLPRR